MKLVIGLIVAFLVGVGCRYFGLPVPSPPVLPGALLVVAMTLGYSVTGQALDRKAVERAARPKWQPSIRATSGHQNLPPMES